MSTTTIITVSSCATCPFYERTVASFIGDLIAKRGERTGSCSYEACGRPFPIGRMHVADPTRIPTQCPLRRGQTVIELDEKAKS